MGIALGDYNRDGKVDLYITNFSDDYNTLYRNEGEVSFTDVSFALRQAGIAEVTIPFYGWGTKFLDFDNDGLQEYFVANGHVYPNVAAELGHACPAPAVPQCGWQEVCGGSPATGSGLAVVVPAKGAAFGDLLQ